MSERTDERTAGEDADLDEVADDVDPAGPTGDVGFDDDELGVDVDALTGSPDSAGTADPGGDGPSESKSSSGTRSRSLRSRLPSLGAGGLLPDLPSPRSVLLTLVVVVGSMLVFGSIPLLGSVGSLLGIFVGAFVLGLASGTRRYAPVALAGALGAGLSLLSGVFALRFAVLADVGLEQLAAVGAGAGVVAAVLGHYFGRDLRNGLSRDVEK